MNEAEKIVEALLESVDSTVAEFASVVGEYAEDIFVDETEIVGDPKNGFANETTVCVHGGVCSTKSAGSVERFLLSLVTSFKLNDRLVYLGVDRDELGGQCPKKLGNYFSFVVHFKPVAHDASNEIAFAESILPV